MRRVRVHPYGTDLESTDDYTAYFHNAGHDEGTILIEKLDGTLDFVSYSFVRFLEPPTKSKEKPIALLQKLFDRGSLSSDERQILLRALEGER